MNILSESFFVCERPVDLAIKERLSKVLDARILGKEHSFSKDVTDTDAERFWLNYRQIDLGGDDSGNNWAIQEVCCDDIYYIQYSNFHQSISLESIRYLFFRQSVDWDDLKDISDDDYEEALSLMDYREEDHDDLISCFKEFVSAYIMASKDGKHTEALDLMPYYEFVRNMRGHYFGGDDYPLELVSMCLPALVYPFVVGTEINPAMGGMIVSKEVALYEKYKENLPSDIRERADDAVSAFFCPFDTELCVGELCTGSFGDYAAVAFSLEFPSEDADSNEEEVQCAKSMFGATMKYSGFEEALFSTGFLTAWKYCIEVLPCLRKEYSKVPASEEMLAA